MGVKAHDPLDSRHGGPAFRIVTHWDAGVEWWVTAEGGTPAHGYAASVAEAVAAISRACGSEPGQALDGADTAALQRLYDDEVDWCLALGDGAHWSVNGGWDQPLEEGRSDTAGEAICALRSAMYRLFRRVGSEVG